MPYQIQNDSTGRSFSIFIQEMSNSCLVGCAITMVRLFHKSSNLGGNEQSVRRDIFRFGQQMAPSISVRLNDPDAIQNMESFEVWGQFGQYIDPIVPYLNTKGVVAKLVSGNSVALCNSASITDPIVIRTSWKATWGGGAHFIICLGTLGANTLFLDPYYGLQERPITDLPKYKPTTGGAKQNSGTLDDEAVRCSRGTTQVRI